MPITNLQLITVTGKYLKLDGTAAGGTVTFTPATVLVNKVAKEIVYPFAFVATLDVNGRFSIVLPSTDDPDISPVGWSYTVVENILGSNKTRSYDLTIPFNAAGATIDLANVSPFDGFGYGGY